MADVPVAPDRAPEDDEARLFLTASAQNSQMHIQCKINAAGPALQALLTATDSQGRTALHLSAAAGHAYTVERLLQAGASTATPDSAGQTPAMLAAAVGHKMVLQKLALADLQAISSNVSTLLLLAASGSTSSHSTVLEFLLQQPGANPNCADPARGGMQALSCAAFAGNIKSVQALLSAGASVHATDTSWKQSIHWAAQGGHASVMELLMRQGASLDATAGHALAGSMNTLHFAAEGGSAIVLRELLRLPHFRQAVNAAVTRPDNSEYRTTALHLAAQAGHLEAVKVLLSFNADINATDTDGATALQLAAANGHAAVLHELATRCSILMNLGAWQRCYSPLHLAAAKGHCEVIAALVDAGVPADVAGVRDDAHGTMVSPVMAAALSEQLQAMKVLLERGAAWDWLPVKSEPLHDLHLGLPSSMTSVPQVNDTVLHHAVSQGKPAMVSMLLSISRADVYLHKKGKSGSTPLDMALGSANPDVLLAIVEKLQQGYISVTAGIESATWDKAWFLAAEKGKANLLSFLSSGGRRVSMRNCLGVTALHLASQHGQDAAVRRLLALGESVHTGSAPPTAPDGTPAPQTTIGNTAIAFAVYGSHVSTIAILLEAGASAGRANSAGITPLHYAAQAGSAEAMSALLKMPAAVAAIDARERSMNATALHLAATWDKGAVAAQLVAAGADVLCENSRRETALLLAAGRGHVSVVEALAQHYQEPALIQALLAAAKDQPDDDTQQQQTVRLLVRQLLATDDRAGASATLRLKLRDLLYAPNDNNPVHVLHAFEDSRLAAETAIRIIKVYDQELGAALDAAEAAAAESRDIKQQRLAVQHLVCGLAGMAKQGLDVAASKRQLEQQTKDFNQQMQAERQRVDQYSQQQRQQLSEQIQAERSQLQQTVDAQVQQEKARQEQQWRAERDQVLQAAQGQSRQIVQAAEDQRRTVLASLDQQVATLNQQAAAKRAQLAALDKQATDKQAQVAEKQTPLQQICAKGNQKQQLLQQINQQGLQAQQQLQQLRAQISTAQQQLQGLQLRQVVPTLQQAQPPSAPQHAPVRIQGRC